MSEEAVSAQNNTENDQGNDQDDVDGEWQNEDFLSLEPQKPGGATNEEYDSMDGDDMETSSSGDDDDDDEEAQNNKSGGIPPWVDRRSPRPGQIHPLTALHNEIVSFTHLMEPLPSEIQQREVLVNRIREMVQKHFDDDTEIQVFGSQATGLFLPTSDIDLVVVTKEGEDEGETNGKKKNERKKTKDKQKNGEPKDGQEESDMSHAIAQKSPLHRFADALEEEWLDELSYIERLENTRIPLVKFTHGPTGISVDVCFNQPMGPPAAQLMKRYLDALPPLRPLTFVLKYFLAARDLNEPYSGGVGSYMLQLLIVSFLQHRERDAVNFKRPSVYNLGALLLEFLELYGEQFNYYTTGISVRYDGFFFPKGAQDRKAIFWKPDRPGLVALENPLDTTQDVGQSSFRFQTVQRAFAVAYKTLLAYATAGSKERQLHVPSILATILPPTDYMTSRLVLKRRDRPLMAKRGREAETSANGNNGRNGKRQKRNY